MLRSRFLAAAALVAATATSYAAFRPAPVQEMPQPGPEHAMILKGVGDYVGTMTMNMPGAQPTKATESVVGHGGFWTVTNFQTEYMGMPFTGSANLGYDPEKKKFIGSWIDSFTPTMTLMEGEWDAEKEMLVMHWEGPDMTGAIVPHRYEQKWTNAGYTSTFFTNGEASMTIEMKRKGKAVEAGAR